MDLVADGEDVVRLETEKGHLDSKSLLHSQREQ